MPLKAPRQNQGNRMIADAFFANGVEFSLKGG
jgi:hypothetical protein